MTSESLFLKKKRVDNSSIIFYRSPLRLPPAIQAFMYMYYILLGSIVEKSTAATLLCSYCEMWTGLVVQSIYVPAAMISKLYITFIPCES